MGLRLAEWGSTMVHLCRWQFGYREIERLCPCGGQRICPRLTHMALYWRLLAETDREEIARDKVHVAIAGFATLYMAIVFEGMISPWAPEYFL